MDGQGMYFSQASDWLNVWESQESQQGERERESQCNELRERKRKRENAERGWILERA